MGLKSFLKKISEKHQQNRLWLLGVFLRRFVSKHISNDKIFVILEYFAGIGKFPHLKNPRTYNEKLQWLKIHDIHPEYTNMVDKAEAKKYAASIIGEQHIIKTLGVWNRFEDIVFDNLPERFVLKTTHDSGGVAICYDKSEYSLNKAKKIINKSLCRNYYMEHREYPYKEIKPRIIAEELMVDESGKELKDYKFFCFDGEPKMLFVATDRPFDTRFDFFDMEWNHLPFRQGHPLANREIQKPFGFDEMKIIAQKLSQGCPHVRVDLYNINGHIYFGELTFFHFSGNVPFVPEEWDYKIGQWLKLPISK